MTIIGRRKYLVNQWCRQKFAGVPTITHKQGVFGCVPPLRPSEIVSDEYSEYKFIEQEIREICKPLASRRGVAYGANYRTTCVPRFVTPPRKASRF